MGVSNGQLGNQTVFNNAFMARNNDTDTIGRVDLKNVAVAASGANVLNVQQHINDFMQNFKLFLISASNQRLTWSGGVLTVLEDLKIRSEDFTIINTIQTGQFPATIADGRSAYVILSRYANANLTLNISATLPKGKDYFRLATRISDFLVLWNGITIKDGESFYLGGGVGVSSIFTDTDATKVTGDVEFISGTNITIARSGNTYTITALGGGSGGGGISYSESSGNVDITLKPPTTTWILRSPDLTYWEVTIANDGTLSATSGGAGPATNLAITKPDLSTVSFGITDAGEITVVSPASGSATINDDFFLSAPDGTAWQILVDNTNTISVESDTDLSNHFAIKSSAGNTLLELLETTQAGSTQGLLYMQVFTASTLPSTPSSISGLLPLCFFNNGSNTTLIYWSGAAWKYVADNSAV